jgi:DNA-binding LacI/PurR family transcriptional regulator
MLKQSGRPVVVVGRTHDLFDFVAANIEEGVFTAAEYLLKTGHRRLCLINCPRVFSTNMDRKNGFLKALKTQKDRAEVYWIADAEHNTGKGGYDAIRRVLESDKKPDSIIAANDSTALGIMRYLYEKNIRVPDDLSVISYDNSVLTGYAAPALSSVDIDKERIGKESCEILMQRLLRPRMRQVALKLPTRLVLRDSVKDRQTCPAAPGRGFPGNSPQKS